MTIHPHTKALAEIAAMFHGAPIATLNTRALDTVAILQGQGFARIVSGLVIITEGTERLTKGAMRYVS